jgi:hypothetical protein
MRIRSLLGIAGAVGLCTMVAFPAYAQWNPKVSGYSQFRYVYSDSDGDGDFDVRRARLSWRDKVNEAGTEYRIQLDFSDLPSGGGSVAIKDLWVSHPFGGGWSGLAGFTTVRFGYELQYSSSRRLPFERSQAARSFFPGERGLGAFLTYRMPEAPAIRFDVAYIDGMDSWDRGEFEDASSFVAKAELPLGNGGAAGLSYMASSIDVSTGGGQSFSPNVWGAHVRWNGALDASRWGVQAEYYDGDRYDHRNHRVQSADGWYAQVEFSPANSPATPFYRYDEFNAAGAPGFSRHTLGVAVDAIANNRLTLQIEDISAADNDTTVGVQWQVTY